MNKTTSWLQFTGYFILAAAVIGLLLFTTYEAWIALPVGGILSFIVLIGSVIAIFFEGKQIMEGRSITLPGKALHLAGEFLAVFLGGVITYFLSQDLNLGPVVSASLVAIIAHLILPEYDVPAYCGSFVGMTSNALLFSHAEVALASAIAGFVFILTRNVFSGIGGKLGTIALIGTAATGVGLGRQFLITPLLDTQTNGLIVLVALIAAPATFYLNCQKSHGPVMASGVVGLIAGLILPDLFPLTGETLAVVAICASFAGMTSKKRCPKFWGMLFAGIFSGLIFVFSTPLLGGAGGKLGTIAFGSVLSVWGYAHIFQ